MRGRIEGLLMAALIMGLMVIWLSRSPLSSPNPEHNAAIPACNVDLSTMTFKDGSK